MQSKRIIQAEISELEALKPKIVRYNAFGGDNWEVIDAQVCVLERNLSMGQINRKYGEHKLGDRHRREIRSAAHIARDWLDGKEIFGGEPDLVACYAHLIHG